MYIMSFADRAPDVLGQLDSKTDPFMGVLAQLWLFPNYPEYHQYWVQEAWAALHKTKKLKSTKRFPSKKQIFRNTFEDNKHIIKAEMNAMIAKESELVPDPMRVEDVEGLTEAMRRYFDWLAAELSTYGVIESAELAGNAMHEAGILNDRP